MKLSRLWPYLLSAFGCVLLAEAFTQHPTDPLVITALMPLVLFGPASSADKTMKRLQRAAKAFSEDEEPK